MLAYCVQSPDGKPIISTVSSEIGKPIPMLMHEKNVTEETLREDGYLLVSIHIKHVENLSF